MAMARFLLAVGAIVILWHSGECVHHRNAFDGISGCLQFDNVPGYHDPQLYIPTSLFRNMVRTPHSRILRMGIVGVNDGIFRYGRSAFPANGEQVVESVLGGWSNTKSAGRLQVRRRNIENTVLKETETPRIMSGSRPLVFKMEVFDNAIKGCRQFDNVPGYNDTQVYMATTTFANVGRTSNSRSFRFGIVGPNDGIIRFGRSTYPFDEAVVELVVGGWRNTQSVARRQTRRRDHTYNNVLLKEASTPQLLCRSRPLLFRIDNGRVQLTKDGERRPFFEYSDSQYAIPADYIAFVKFDVNLIYFYDCPLEDESVDSGDSVLLRCSLA
ncbi:AGAP006193-PA-like protein [Anopheles sinensis]|uniref:AGAP006193-PA-like protein n=1 Tax=Anopheles sinensis TaxID=74873 RepID=A0A084WL80_ANOSI|nr:AGAP006193-PA-like protein [Anopheles sinensis]